MKFNFKKYNSKNIDNSINSYLINNNSLNKKYFLTSINKIKKNYLEKSGAYLLKLSKENIIDIKNNTLRIGKGFGVLQKQNKKGDKVISVESKKTKKKNLRYHQTNIEGSIHTDGPQLNKPPKIIILSCKNNAKIGGETILSDAERIHKYLQKNKKEVLNNLKKKYFFEKKGFSKSIIKKPIYTYSHKMKFRYIREYIYSGYELKKKKIPDKQLEAIKILDHLMKQEENRIKFKLKSGDVIIVNNEKRAHGRKKFSKRDKAKRKLYRVWVKG